MSEALGFLSIGEVLSLIKKDFPDVSISKIRYLESQGLIDPERTPSGYRKFYSYDIERLKKVLYLQRDSFLPLKVIKDTLDGRLAEPPDVVVQPTLEFQDHEDEPSDNVGLNTKDRGDEQSQLVDLVSRLAQRDDLNSKTTHMETEQLAQGGSEKTNRHAVQHRSLENSTQAPDTADHKEDLDPTDPKTAMRNAEVFNLPVTPPSAAASSLIGNEPPKVTREDLLSVEELSRLTGARLSEINEIESFGLIESKVIAGEHYYLKLDFEIVQLVLVFKKYGVSSRHLRMYKLSAEREVGFMEQVITPLLRQRNPQARHKAQDQLSDLRTLGSCLRGYFMERLLDKYLQL